MARYGIRLIEYSLARGQIYRWLLLGKPKWILEALEQEIDRLRRANAVYKDGRSREKHDASETR